MAFHAGPLRSAIHALKYKNNPALAESLVWLMNEHWPGDLPGQAVLVPVPLAEDRARQRGFNQSEVLARQLARNRNLPVLPRAVQRIRATPPQVGLNASQRRQNVQGAFSADPAQTRDQAVILIDDVCTTGATLGACAEALLQAGARWVWGYTLARAPFAEAELLN